MYRLRRTLGQGCLMFGSCWLFLTLLPQAWVTVGAALMITGIGCLMLRM